MASGSTTGTESDLGTHLDQERRHGLRSGSADVASEDHARRGGTQACDVSAADALRTSCVLSPDDMARAEAVADERGVTLERAVVEMGLLAEDQVLWFVARQADIDLVFPTVDGVDADLLARFPADVLRRLEALPMLQDDDGAIVVAFPTPPDAAKIEELARASGTRVRAALAAAPRLRRVLARLLGAPTDDPPETSQDPPVDDVAAVTALYRHLTVAFRDGVEEVRFEPAADFVRVRYRFGGVLRTAGREPSEFGPAVAARARTLAGLAAPAWPVAERSTLRISVGGRPRRISLVIVPTAHGPSVLLRMLPSVDIPAALDAWPLAEDAEAWIAGRFLGPAAGNETLHVRSEDDDLRRGLLRAVACAADAAGLAVVWVGPPGIAGPGPWLDVDGGPGADEIVAAARPDVVISDASQASFPGVRRVVVGVPGVADDAPVDRAVAVLDVSAESVACSACDGMRSAECGQCRGAPPAGARIVVETRRIPGGPTSRRGVA